MVTKAEALEHFGRVYVQERVWKKLMQAEEYYHRHYGELKDGFLRSFQAIVEEIRRRQAVGALGPVGYIQYSMLRSALLAKRPTHRIDVYNEKWYFDSTQKECQGEYDGSTIFNFLDELVDELDEPRKRYFGVISPADLELIKRQEAAKFNQFIIHLAGQALRQAEKEGQIPEFTKANEFEVRVGEYYDLSEVVYKEDLREKDAEEIKEWLEDKHQDQYVAAVLRNLDLSAGDDEGIDLRRVDMCGSDFSGSNLQKCLLINSCLSGCTMVQTDFSHALIHEADFQDANLSRAVFQGVDGACGIRAAVVTGIFSLTGVNFAGANLEAADFTGAALPGKVIDLEKDMVRVHLAIDQKQDKETARWFRYATCYTAEGNSGFYCMPVLGDQVNLYFPTGRELDAVVLNSVRQDRESCSKIQTPAVKYWGTDHGKELMMGGKELKLTAKDHKDGKIFIKLDDEQGVEIRSDSELYLTARKNLTFDMEKKVSIKAKDEIQLVCGSCSIDLDGITHLKGPRVTVEPRR